MCSRKKAKLTRDVCIQEVCMRWIYRVAWWHLEFFCFFSNAEQLAFLIVVTHHVCVFLRFLCSDRIRCLVRGSKLPAVVLTHSWPYLSHHYFWVLSAVSLLQFYHVVAKAQYRGSVSSISSVLGCLFLLTSLLILLRSLCKPEHWYGLCIRGRGLLFAESMCLVHWSGL